MFANKQRAFGNTAAFVRAVALQGRNGPLAKRGFVLVRKSKLEEALMRLKAKGRAQP